jgi:hypothetical protein
MNARATNRWVPHISLVFGEMWDTAGLSLKLARVPKIRMGAKVRQSVRSRPIICSSGEVVERSAVLSNQTLRSGSEECNLAHRLVRVYLS